MPLNPMSTCIDTIEKRTFSKPVVGEQGKSCIIIKQNKTNKNPDYATSFRILRGFLDKLTSTFMSWFGNKLLADKNFFWKNDKDDSDDDDDDDDEEEEEGRGRINWINAMVVVVVDGKQ